MKVCGLTIILGKNMANNLEVKNHNIVSIYKLCSHETEIKIQSSAAFIPRNNNFLSIQRKYSKFKSKMEITHEVHYSGKTMIEAQNMTINPNFNVGIMVWLAAASALNRPSNSKVLYYNNKLYYYLSWTDMLGPGHGRGNAPQRTRNGKLIHFLHEIENDRHKELLLEHIRDIELI